MAGGLGFKNFGGLPDTSEWQLGIPGISSQKVPCGPSGCAGGNHTAARIFYRTLAAR